MTSEPTAIFYNPAGIARSEGGHLFGDTSIAWRSATYDRPNADAPVPAGAEGANTGRATLFNVLVEPFVGATYRIGNAAIGAAYYTPFGGQDSWNTNDQFRGNTRFPGAVDGVQRWYTIDGILRSSFLSVAGAYRFGRVSLGVSGNLIQTVANNVQAHESTGGDDVRTEGRAWLDATSLDLSAGFGITYEPLDGLLLGLSYQSRPGFGSGIRATGDVHLSFAGSESVEQVAFTTDLPDIIRAGAAYRGLDRVELRLFGDYQRWSALEHQCIFAASSDCRINPDGSAQAGSDVILNYVRNWHDTFGVRGGVSYWPSPDVELVTGAGFASKAVPNSTLEPALLDFDAVTAAVGGIFRIGDLHLATTYTEVFYIPRDTTGQSIHPTLRGVSRSPDSGGKYSLALGLLNVNLDFAF